MYFNVLFTRLINNFTTDRSRETIEFDIEWEDQTNPLRMIKQKLLFGINILKLGKIKSE